MNDLTKGPEGKLIFYFALPMLLGNVFQQFYNVADSIIVGKFLGKEALAAVGASFPIIYALIAFIIGIGSGASVVISQYFGAKKYDQVKAAIDTTLVMLIAASVLVTSLGLIFLDPILRFFQLPEEIIPLAKDYLQIYISGMIVFFGYNGTSSILRGLGDSKTPLYFMIISTIINIVLDYVFIVNLGWGVKGAGLATVIAQGGAFISAIIYLNKTHKLVQFKLWKYNFDWEIFKQALRIGLPTALQQTFVALGIIALFGIVNTFGTDVIAAYSAAGRIDSLAVIPAMNFSAAIASFTGQNLGAKLINRVKRGLKLTLLMSSSLSLVGTIVIVLFSDALMRLFVTDANVIAIGKEYLIVVSLFYVIFSAMFILHGMMRGAGATLIPMYTSLLSLWVIRIPLAYWLSRHFGETGIWYAIPIAWITGLTATLIYYYKGNWQNKSVIK